MSFRGIRVEDVIEKALVKIGAIEFNAGSFKKISWQRSTHTDKGVSAVGLVVSSKLLDLHNLFLDVNKALPGVIFGVKWTIRSFSERMRCEAWTYHYILPTYCFKPTKVHIILKSRPEIERDLTSKSMMLSPYNQNKKFYDYSSTDDGFEYKTMTEKKLKKLIKEYVGVHNFFNYTSGIEYASQQAIRRIIHFDVSDPFMNDGIEMIRFTIKGQSFVLHQIRKMIAYVVCLLRDNQSSDMINASFMNDRIRMHRAPSLCHYLKKCHFIHYNSYCDEGKYIFDALRWKESEASMNAFENDIILKQLIEKEKKEKVFSMWCNLLDFYPLDYEGIRSQIGSCQQKEKREHGLKQK